LKPNEKRRSNAKADKIKRSIYVHEKADFDEALDAIITAVGRAGPNDQSMRYKIVGNDLRTTRFKMTWTLARTDFSDMELASVDDYKEMLNQMSLKGKEKIGLDIKELELEVSSVRPSGLVCTQFKD
jgi:hypothetical protein